MTLYAMSAGTILRCQCRHATRLLKSLAARLGRAAPAVDDVAFGLAGPVGLALACCLALNLWPELWPARRARARAVGASVRAGVEGGRGFGHLQAHPKTLG